MAEASLEEMERALGHRFRDPALIYRALTHRSAAGEGGVAGPVADNEQLEYLGDAVLGMLVSEYLVESFPAWTEGQLSRSRARLVSAAALHAAARRLDLGRYLRLGRGEEKTGGRRKPALLANALEAVIAAIYLDAGLEAARAFVVRNLLGPAREEARHLGRADHKSALQEWLQARGLSPALYRVVREAGPDHCKTYWVEVAVPGAVSATGTGATKKEAEQSAAERALEQLVAAPAV